MLVLLGDNLIDLDHAFDQKGVTERDKVVDSLRSKWGGCYIVFPNAIYGDWEGSLYYDFKKQNSKITLNQHLKDSIRRTLLHSYYKNSAKPKLGSYSTIANGNLEIIDHWLIAAAITSEANSVSNVTPAPNIRMNTYNILAGKIYKQMFSLVTLSAGLGVVSVYTYNNPLGAASGTIYRKYQYTAGAINFNTRVPGGFPNPGNRGKRPCQFKRHTAVGRR